FHFFVISGLLFYLPNEPDVKEKAAAFALLIHGVQTIFIMISGVISLLLLPILNRKR
ncbi:MAG: TIGR00374 family protein, partial [Bacteroidia bacterium]